MFSGSLRAFDETVRAGSIRKASEILGVAPSSVSRHIAMLEREMGTALFDRRSRGVVLTFAGRMVADYARSVLVDYDTLRTDLNDLRGTQRRLIRLSVVESIASSGLVEAINDFLKRFPTLSFSIRLLPAPAVVEAVRQDLCDIGLAFCVEGDPDLLHLARLSEPIVVLLAADHPQANAKEIHLADLAGVKLALPDDDFGVRRIFDRATAEAGLRLTPTLSSNVFETLREFVRGGGGAAVLPARAAGRSITHGMACVPLAGPAFQDAHIDLIVLRRRRLPRVVKAFVDVLVEAISPDVKRSAKADSSGLVA
jgi:DNA-binding transcriptional LysR family regulator